MSYEANVRKVVPYTPGEQPKVKNIIKLNTNENPYPPCPGVKEVLRQVDVSEFRKYPDPVIADLTNELASYHKVSPAQVFVGVGSDDVLANIFLTFFNSDKPILFPDITYSFYDVWAQLFRIPYETLALDDDFNIVASDYLRENGGIIFPNPNAPTGVLVDLDFIEGIVKANRDSVVVVDEAYIDFGGVSALPLIEKYDNLMVVRTYSKSRSMAGIRIGYAIGNEKLIKYLSDVKFSFNSYTLSNLNIAMGVASLRDEAYFMECVGKVVKTREDAKLRLRELGFAFRDSKANFIFVKHKSVSGELIFNKLKEKGIFVRRFNAPRISEYLRISIGTDEEMNALFDALKDIIREAE